MKLFFDAVKLQNAAVIRFFFSPEKPHNPMVNSGSILTNALLQSLMKPEMSLAEKFDYVNDYVKVGTRTLGLIKGFKCF